MAEKRKRDNLYDGHLTGRESRRRGSWRDNMDWQYQSVQASTLLANNNMSATPTYTRSERRDGGPVASSAIGSSGPAGPSHSSSIASSAPVDSVPRSIVHPQMPLEETNTHSVSPIHHVNDQNNSVSTSCLRLKQQCELFDGCKSEC